MRIDYFGLKETIRQVRLCNPRAIEEGIRFLSADLYAHRSGYFKEELWRVIAHVKLTESQRRRLQHVALRYLDRKLGREFWPMCRAMAGLALPGFATEVDRRIATATAAPQRRASLLRAYLDGIEHGEHARQALQRNPETGRS
jgi:hypothetical protein